MNRTLMGALLGAVLACNAGRAAEPAIDIGSRRELFVDRYLIDRIDGAELKLHSLRPAQPSPQPALGGHYATVLRDGEKFRQYCRGDKVAGLHWREDGWEAYHAAELTLLAESTDGVHWTLPNLGLYDVPRYPKGNVVLADRFLVNHNFTPWIDTRPGVPAQQRYKALGGERYRPQDAHLKSKYGAGGLYAFVSPDGVHWKRLRQEPVIPESWGSFDSQNVAFYSPAEGHYVCYFRTIEKGFRAVRRSTSDDLVNWTAPVTMKGRLEKEHLYTNGTHPYFRAPHIYIAPATWFLPGENPNTRVILMTSRAGSDTFDRTFGREEFLPNAAAGNRTNYIAWTNGAQTGPRELSFYSLGKRFTLRLDGFGSLRAGKRPAEVVTRPLRFAGGRLAVNFATHGGGRLRIELQHRDGRPIDGFQLDRCTALAGDETDKAVQWTGRTDLATLAGKPVRLRIVLEQADLFALQFTVPR